MKSYKNYGSNGRYNGQFNHKQMNSVKRGVGRMNRKAYGYFSQADTTIGITSRSRKTSATERSAAEDVLQLFSNVCNHLNKRNFEPSVVAAIVNLNAGLKMYGSELLLNHKSELGDLISQTVKASKERELDLVARLQLVEIIEMNSNRWEPNETVANYYKQKVEAVENSTAREALDHLNNTATFDLKNALSKSLASTSKGLNPYAPDFTPTLTARYLAKASDSLANMLHLGPNSCAASSSDEHEVSEFHLSSDSGHFASDEHSANSQCDKKETRSAPVSPGWESCASGDGAFSRHGQEYQAVVGSGYNYITIRGKNVDLISRAKSAVEDCFRRLNVQDSNLANEDSSVISSQLINLDIDSSANEGILSPTNKGTNTKALSPKKHVSISDQLQVINGDGTTIRRNKQSKKFVYTRKELLKCAETPFSKIVPVTWSADWEQVKFQHPSLIRYDMILGLQENGSKRTESMPPIPDANSVVSFPEFVSCHLLKEHTSPESSPKSRGENSPKPIGPTKIWDEAKDDWVEISQPLAS